METTTIYQELNQKVNGYMINAELSPATQTVIARLQQKIIEAFGDSVYIMPLDALHITLMDWVAPLVDYGEDKTDLYERNLPQYDQILNKVIEAVDSIALHFDRIRVSAGAVYLQAHDNGTFQHIRDSFLREAELVPGTKQPPKIIHTTIARFLKEISLADVQKYIADESIDQTELVTRFRLVNETQIPMLGFEVLKSYQLSVSSGVDRV